MFRFLPFATALLNTSWVLEEIAEICIAHPTHSSTLDPYACSALISPGERRKVFQNPRKQFSLKKFFFFYMLRSKSGNAFIYFGGWVYWFKNLWADMVSLTLGRRMSWSRSSKITIVLDLTIVVHQRWNTTSSWLKVIQCTIYPWVHQGLQFSEVIWRAQDNFIKFRC